LKPKAQKEKVRKKKNADVPAGTRGRFFAKKLRKKIS
jgi:hypothetical protein